MKFGFVAKHRGAWPVEVLCGALGVSRSGFYAWRTRAPSRRAVTDARILLDVRRSFLLSDRTYGARRILDDVRDAGHTCGRQHVARLMRREALWARPRRRAHPVDPSGRPAHTLAPNVLDRQFTTTGPNQKWVADFTYVWTSEGWLFVAVVLDLFSRRVGRVVDAASHDRAARDRCAYHGDLAAGDDGRPAPSFRPGESVRERVVPAAPPRPRGHLQHEPGGQRLGQRGHGEFLFDAQDRTHELAPLPNPECGAPRRVRLHRTLLQSAAEALDPRQPEPDRL